MKKYFVLLLLIIITISCSKTSDQEYLTQAEKSLAEDNVDQAIKSIESLLSRISRK